MKGFSKPGCRGNNHFIVISAVRFFVYGIIYFNLVKIYLESVGNL